MTEPLLEDVFKLSGIPTYTFVKPPEYNSILIALRTAGRGVVVEGPSGIGKTTAITRALEDLGLADSTLRLSARKREDREIIEALPEIQDIGVVIIDDFHRLDRAGREMIADFMKTLADESAEGSKVVVIGINKAKETLIAFAPDLNNRVEVIRFEANPPEKVAEVVAQGEEALNIEIDVSTEIVEAANGGFYIAQMLAHNTCLLDDVTERQEQRRVVEVSFETVRTDVMERLTAPFWPIARDFARGPRMRSEGRAPYLHILRWLAEANEWSISLDTEMARHAILKGSVGQVVDKGYLEKHVNDNESIRSVLHFESSTGVVAVEDPQFVFYIRNLAWNEFARNCGFLNVSFDSGYDFALSFAGTDRAVAEKLAMLLMDAELQVFYDRHEQHRILAEDVEQYLAPIYRSEALFVVCLLGPEYPNRVWTKFESEQFKERFRDGAVIPVWFTTAPPGMFDETRRVGGVTFDPDGDVDSQLEQITEMFIRKLRETAIARQVAKEASASSTS